MARTQPAGFSLAELRVRPATPARWGDIETLFGPRGACAGCWCMWALLPSREFHRGSGEGNRRALRKLVRGGAKPGLIAYHGREPVAWCALGPRERYVRLDHSRTWQRVDDRPVWSIVCFFIARPYRKRGLMAWLLREAARFVQARGGRILEGYPTQPKSGRTGDAFVYTGVPSAFERAGFREVLRRSPTRPIMRRMLRPEGDARRSQASATRRAPLTRRPSAPRAARKSRASRTTRRRG